MRTILPTTTPLSEKPLPPAAMVHVIADGAEPFVAWLVKLCPPAENVRSSMVGTKIPVPPDANVRCATFQVFADCALPLLTTNTPVTPFPQSNVPVKELGAFAGAADAAGAASPAASAATKPATEKQAGTQLLMR